MAMQPQFSDKWQEIRAIHRQYGLFYKALLIGLGVMIGAVLFGDVGYISNLWTEGLSVALTILVLNALAEQREERRRIKDLQERLVMEAGSQSNETAKRAIDELRHRGWLEGANGLLKGGNLVDARLEGANLQNANLESANLVGTHLEESNLDYVNLQGANLQYAHLRKAKMNKAILHGVNFSWADAGLAELQGAGMKKCQLTNTNLGSAMLQVAQLNEADLRFSNLTNTFFTWAKLNGARLSYSNLQNAILSEANLEGASLAGSNLKNAILVDVELNSETILPDGTRWTPGTDLTRFTDPNHPQFWRSDNPYSPAYRGK